MLCNNQHQECCRQGAMIVDVDTAQPNTDLSDIRHLLQMHKDHILNHVEVVITSQHQQLVTQIAEAVSRSIDRSHTAGDDPSRSKGPQMVSQEPAAKMERESGTPEVKFFGRVSPRIDVSHTTCHDRLSSNEAQDVSEEHPAKMEMESDMPEVNEMAEVFEVQKSNKLEQKAPDDPLDFMNGEQPEVEVNIIDIEEQPVMMSRMSSMDAGKPRGGTFIRHVAKPTRNTKRVDEYIFRMAETVNAGAEIYGARKCLKLALSSIMYDAVMMCIIMFNAGLIILEVDYDAACPEEKDGCAPAWISSANLVLLTVYTLEAIVVFYVHRLKVFEDASMLFEMFIVLAGFVDLAVKGFGSRFPSLTVLKLIRLSRLLRGLRLILMFPELRYIMVGFLGAMRAVLWGLLLMMIILMAAGIVAIELIAPLGLEVDHQSEYCKEAFGSVWKSTMYFFQTVPGGDSWGACSIPIIWHSPLTFLFFGSVLVGVQLGLLNLIMSVILDRVQEKRSADGLSQLRAKEKAIQSSRKKWFDFFEQLDKDGSGELSLQEVLEGFDTIPDFNMDMRLFGIERDHIEHLLELMDEDGNGQISSDELFSVLDMIIHFDDKLHQVTVGMQLRMVAQRFDKRIRKIHEAIRDNEAALHMMHESMVLCDTPKFGDSNSSISKRSISKRSISAGYKNGC